VAVIVTVPLWVVAVWLLGDVDVVEVELDVEVDVVEDAVVVVGMV
jgi:hypothetical protein